MAAVELKMGDVMRRTTLEVVITGRRRAAVRTRIGSWLILLAAHVMGCDVEIGTGPTHGRS